MKKTAFALLLLLVPAARANKLVCNDGVCRMVETDPIPASPQVPAPAAKRVIDKKFLLLTAVNVGVSIAATRSLVACRADHGIGPCTDGGYGPFEAREILRQVTTAASIPLSWKIKSIEDGNQDKHKFWWIIQAVPLGINAGVMIQNASKHYGPKAD